MKSMGILKIVPPPQKEEVPKAPPPSPRRVEEIKTEKVMMDSLVNTPRPTPRNITRDRSRTM